MVDLEVLNTLLYLTETRRDVSEETLLRVRRHQTEEIARLRIVVAVLLAVIEPPTVDVA